MALIQPNEISTLARTIYTNDEIVERLIAEAESMDIRRQLGDALYLALQGAPEGAQYTTLLQGGTYAYNGANYVCEGVKRALAYYVYARIIRDANIQATEYGAVIKEDENSSKAYADERARQYREAFATADTLMQSVLQFLNRCSALFPEYNIGRPQRNPRGGFRVLDSSDSYIRANKPSTIIIQGEKGEKGEKGDKGDKGDPGQGVLTPEQEAHLEGSVRFDQGQSLIDTQKGIARSNIGAMGFNDFNLRAVRFDQLQTLTEPQQAQARQNIGAISTEQMTAAILVEKLRAEAKEFELQEAIDREVSRASSAESDLHNEILTEQGRAEDAEAELSARIDAIVQGRDVRDIVPNYQALLDYDTDTLGDNDIIMVLLDNTKSDHTTYYRWHTDTQSWEFIGGLAFTYTKTEIDQKFADLHIVLPVFNEQSSQELLAQVDETIRHAGADAQFKLPIPVEGMSGNVAVTYVKYNPMHTYLGVFADDRSELYHITRTLTAPRTYTCEVITKVFASKYDLSDLINSLYNDDPEEGDLGDIVKINQQIATMSEDMATRLATDLSNIDEQGEQVIKEIAGHFVAEYRITTYAEVSEAYNAGKTVLVKLNDALFHLTHMQADKALFGGVYSFVLYNITLSSDDKWTTSTASIGKSITDYVGDKADLQTTDKSTIVAAINEVAQGGGSGADEVLRRDFGKYTSNEQYSALSIAQSGKAVATSGTIINKSGYGISNEIAITKGNIYLFKSNTDIADVALFTQKIVADIVYSTIEEILTTSSGESITRLKSKTTAKGADLKSHTYEYVYNAGNETAVWDNIKDNGVAKGASFEIPTQYTEYVPMFSANGVVSRPISGYYCLAASVTGTMVISAKIEDLTGYLVEVRYGVVASIVNNLARKADVEVVSGLYKRGVISQKQTWARNYESYTLSEIVYGAIPIEVIDKWKSLSGDMNTGTYPDVVYYSPIFTFNEETGYFEVDAVKDLTYKDVLEIIGLNPCLTYFISACISGTHSRGIYAGNLGGKYSAELNLGVKGGNYLQFVYLGGVPSVSRCANWKQDIYENFANSIYCQFVKYINLASRASLNCTGMFALREFLAVNLSCDVSFADSRLLEITSVDYLIRRSITTKAIVITLHPEVYTKAMADTRIQASLAEHTNITLASV